MASRAIASSNQWREETGPIIGIGVVIAHTDFAGFVTVVESGTAAAYMVTDATHSGFVTPDDSASSGNASFLILGDFASLIGTV